MEELLHNEKMFFDVSRVSYNIYSLAFQISGVLPMFPDLDSLLLQLVKIPKKATLHSSRGALNCLVWLQEVLMC